MKEQLTKASHDAGFLADDLEEAVKASKNESDRMTLKSLLQTAIKLGEEIEMFRMVRHLKDG